MKGDMKGQHEGGHEGCYEGSKVKGYKPLHHNPSLKLHSNTSETLFNISLHTTLHLPSVDPSLAFTSLQGTLQTGEVSPFGPRRKERGSRPGDQKIE